MEVERDFSKEKNKDIMAIGAKNEPNVLKENTREKSEINDTKEPVTVDELIEYPNKNDEFDVLQKLMESKQNEFKEEVKKNWLKLISKAN